MIKHIVMWTLKEVHEGKNKAQLAIDLKDALMALENKIETLKYIEVGINGVNFDRNHDVVLVSDFNSYEDLEVYAKHPEHLKVVDFVRTISTGRAAVDYQF